MKRVFVVLAVVASLFVGVKSASAMTEEKLKEVLTKTYTINVQDNFTAPTSADLTITTPTLPSS